MYKIFYTKAARDVIGHLDNKTKLRIKNAVEKIAENPSIGKHLAYDLSGRQSYRVGDYRIIYRTYEKDILILILAVGHRRQIYRDISRRLFQDRED